MILAFVIGWILGSISLYSYLVMTAQEPPYPECMDCENVQCGGCPFLATDEETFNLAA
jgi:hypothetical protein